MAGRSVDMENIVLIRIIHKSIIASCIGKFQYYIMIYVNIFIIFIVDLSRLFRSIQCQRTACSCKSPTSQERMLTSTPITIMPAITLV